MLRSLLLLIFINSSISTYSKSIDYELELVQVLFRHGDRTITASEVYPKDPYNLTTYEPFGLGQLTNQGKRRIYNLGRQLSKRYKDLIGGTYEPGLVYGYSTNVDRTKMSLQLVLAGLFPPTPDVEWSKNVTWSPIPTNYNPDTFDFLQTAYYCPKFQIIWNATLASPKLQRQLNEYRDFIEYLSNSTGLPNDPNIAVHLYENIHSQMNLGLDYPSWCNDSIFEKMGNVSAIRYDLFVYTDLMKQIVVGPTIRRFLRNIKSSGRENRETKMYLYSAHDDNVVTFVRTHELSAPRMTDYGSAIVFEKLKGNDTQTYVRILYYPGEGDDFQVMKLKNCDKICSLSKYLKIIKPALPFGEGTECLYEEAFKDVTNVINGLKSSFPPNILELKYVKV